MLAQPFQLNHVHFSHDHGQTEANDRCICCCVGGGRGEFLCMMPACVMAQHDCLQVSASSIHHSAQRHKFHYAATRRYIDDCIRARQVYRNSPPPSNPSGEDEATCTHTHAHTNVCMYGNDRTDRIDSVSLFGGKVAGFRNLFVAFSYFEHAA